MDPSPPIPHHESQSSTTDDGIKSESLPSDALYLTTQTLFPAPTTSGPRSSASSPAPIPSTETNGNDSPSTTSMPGVTKKKGTAMAAKKAPKRAKQGKPKKAAKKAKREPQLDSGTPAGSNAGDDEEDEEEEDGTDDESDHGPYCICRGPDDHRWMICCEKCEDWFHGECINLDKSIGESLIEKFICPLCTKGALSSVYKKTCAVRGCRKSARQDKNGNSVFCSNDHAAIWWERMVGRLPKAGKTKSATNSQLTQDELMALLSSGLVGLDAKGVLTLAKTPFEEPIPEGEDGALDQDLSHILTDEEKLFLDGAAKFRHELTEETLLCHKMLTLIEHVQARRRSLISAGSFGEDICGYDPRLLDTSASRDAFASFVKSTEGDAIFSSITQGEPITSTSEGDSGSSTMCDRKRCKTHLGWQKTLPHNIKTHIKEMAQQADELGEEEKIMRGAASERWRRKKAESNWVERVDG